MEITRATEYAVRCILHLALEPADRVVPRREIAAAREIPEHFLGKIAQRLARAGVIRILQGARGGYQLAVPAERLTLLAVVEAADPIRYRLRVSRVIGCGAGCEPEPSCSGGQVVGPGGLGSGDVLWVPASCLTHTGVR